MQRWFNSSPGSATNVDTLSLKQWQVTKTDRRSLFYTTRPCIIDLPNPNRHLPFLLPTPFLSPPSLPHHP